MSREFRGVWIPAIIWLSRGIDALEKCLLIEIDSFCRKGSCYASNVHFSEMFGCSESSITRAIKRLVGKGLIKATYTKTKDGEIRVLQTILWSLSASQIDEPPLVNLEKTASQIDEGINTEEINTKDINTDGLKLLNDILENLKSKMVYKSQGGE